MKSWLTKDQRFKGRSPIEHLFNKLDMLYPMRWRSQFKSAKDHENWCQCWGEELEDRSVTFDEAKAGIDRCIELYTWPPSFPEFLKACRPSLDYEAAFCEAVEQMQKRNDEEDERWSNPAIYWASVKLGVDIMNTVYLNVKVRWKSALDEAIHKVQAGILPTEIPVRKVSLPPPKRSKNMSAVAIRELAKVNDILSKKSECKEARLQNSGLKPMMDYLPINREVA